MEKYVPGQRCSSTKEYLSVGRVSYFRTEPTHRAGNSSRRPAPGEPLHSARRRRRSRFARKRLFSKGRDQKPIGTGVIVSGGGSMIRSTLLVPASLHFSHRSLVSRNFFSAELSSAASIRSVISSSSEQFKHLTLAVTRNAARIAARIIRLGAM